MVCKICGNPHDNQLHQPREMMFGLRHRFTYLSCAQCGCLQLEDPPSDMSIYYPSEYYSLAENPEAWFSNPVKKAAKELLHTYAVTNQGLIGKWLYARHPDEPMRSLVHTGVSKGSRILDVGCGTGARLYGLSNAGFDHVLGIDPFIDETIRYKNGLTILKQSIYQTDGPWDVIMFHHSFEHVPDPLETLRDVRRLLAPDGVCLIRIPVASSYARSHYQANWVQIDAPRHYFLPSIEGMHLLSARAGLTLEKVVDDSTEFQFWGSEQYIKDIPLHSETS
jgi:2-polyprenyl-3-methyl-5-hydroxy-6-metoxy-1,4-benzoquinol methylase